MGFFKRKKDEEAKIKLEQEALEKLNTSGYTFEIPEDSEQDNALNSDWQINGKTKAPHTITAEEINSKSQKNKPENADDNIAEEIPMTQSEETANSPTDFLFQKMMQSRAKIEEDSITAFEEKDTEPQPENNDDAVIEDAILPAESNDTDSQIDIDAVIEDIKKLAQPTIKKDEPINNNGDTNKNDADADIELKEVSAPSFDSDDNDNSSNVPSNDEDEFSSKSTDNIGASAEERRTTLLARCNAYLEGTSDSEKDNAEKYKLESVESILESIETRAAEKANKKHSVTSKASTSISASSTPSPTTKVTDNTVVFKPPVVVETTPSPLTSDPKEVKHIFTATENTNKTTTPAEDLSSTRVLTDISSRSNPVDILSSSKTAVFPIVESVLDTAKGNNHKIENDDSTNEKEEKADFDDYTSVKDRQKILNNLISKKRIFSFKALLTFLVFVISIFITTPISGIINIPLGTANIIDLSVCAAVAFINLNAITNIACLFNSKANTGLPAALSILGATIFSVVNLIFKGEFAGLSSVAAFSLLSYNIANKNFYSKTIKNFNIIANAEVKNAVSIIQNKNTTKSIVDKAIEGSALVCYSGGATNVHNFLRYTYCKNPVLEKIQKLSLISVIIGIGLALASLVLTSGNAITSIYIFSAAICCSAMPSAYHIVCLTVNSANKRLNHYGAMITGYRAADELELCNAIAISCNDLFPEGTIRLVDMKPLSSNPLDQSMLDAAAISAAIKSPIAGIFKQVDIAKSYNTSNLNVDTVIYEEKMGISGWVNDRRVFVGNRDLLVAHGFTGLPPAELDKKIMRKGFYPVYIASDNIPCALLIVRYEPDDDIIYELQRLANTGTTIIVENCDPNINAKMLTDYFELYSETVFVMTKQGADFYKALTVHKENRRAGAAYKFRIEGLLATLTAAINIKKYISRMSVIYICGIILSLLGITACLFTSLTSLITPVNILIVQLVLTAITLLPTVLRKP